MPGFFAGAALFVWLPCGVGLSLHSFWSISVAPVRGGTYFSLLLQREATVLEVKRRAVTQDRN
ncbi:hypothetical protein, partial [Paraburkholderia domus]|uniref:hypothetical protein n=1 Tax=Paraburkholderia domus TaxID=2793075 RepID=UPI001BA5F8A1